MVRTKGAAVKQIQSGLGAALCRKNTKPRMSELSECYLWVFLKIVARQHDGCPTAETHTTKSHEKLPCSRASLRRGVKPYTRAAHHVQHLHKNYKLAREGAFWKRPVQSNLNQHFVER